jgi:uncharacterized membrane protein YoaK (UPF0700 family)
MEDEPGTRRRVAMSAAVAGGLAAVAGFVDAVGFIVLRGLFTAHQSGNAAQVGVRLGHGDLEAAVPLIVAIVLFVVGAGLGAAVGGHASRRSVARVAPTLALQALLVAAFMTYGEARVGSGRVSDHSLSEFYVLAALAILAMGMQAASIRSVGGQSIRTAYISGVLTDLGRGIVERVRDRDPGIAVGLLAGIVALYLGGACVGSLLHSKLGLWALAVPLGALLAAAAADLRRPLAPS